jgi:hypothetical protein
MVFADGFLFLANELGFWTNPGHWVRVLDAVGPASERDLSVRFRFV